MKEVVSAGKQRSADALLSHESIAPAATIPQPGWRRLVARIRSWFEVPFGYEDESGFHYGHEPRPKVHTDRACDAMFQSAIPTSPPQVEAAEPRRHQTV